MSILGKVFLTGSALSSFADSWLETSADGVLLSCQTSATANPSPDQLYPQTQALMEALRRRPSPPLIYLQIDPLSSPSLDETLPFLLSLKPTGLILPSARGGGDIQHLSTKIGVYETLQDQPLGTTRIWAYATQNADACWGLKSYQDASSRLEALIWTDFEFPQTQGEDLLNEKEEKEMEREKQLSSSLFVLTRGLLLLAASSAGTWALEGPSSPHVSSASLQIQSRRARDEGFSGKIASHPCQVPLLQEIF